MPSSSSRFCFCPFCCTFWVLVVFPARYTERGSFLLSNSPQDSSAMDPNQTSAGPDGPDKEKMEQVSRLVHPLSCHRERWPSRQGTDHRRYRFEHDVWPSWAIQLPQSRRRARLQRLEAHHRLLLRSRALQPPRPKPRPRRPRSTSHRRPSRPQTPLRS